MPGLAYTLVNCSGSKLERWVGLPVSTHTSSTFLIVIGKVSIGRGAGPPVTSPYLLNSEPWHGQWNWPSASAHGMEQPRCVHFCHNASIPSDVRTIKNRPARTRVTLSTV